MIESNNGQTIKFFSQQFHFSKDGLPNTAMSVILQMFSLMPVCKNITVTGTPEINPLQAQF